MRLIKLSAIFASIHIAIISIVFFLQDSFELGKINDYVLGVSIYMPLLFWEMTGVDAVHNNGAILPPPSIIGWLLCMVTWLTIYIVISCIILKVSRKT